MGANKRFLVLQDDSVWQCASGFDGETPNTAKGDQVRVRFVEANVVRGWADKTMTLKKKAVANFKQRRPEDWAKMLDEGERFSVEVGDDGIRPFPDHIDDIFTSDTLAIIKRNFKRWFMRFKPSMNRRMLARDCVISILTRPLNLSFNGKYYSFDDLNYKITSRDMSKFMEQMSRFVEAWSMFVDDIACSVFSELVDGINVEQVPNPAYAIQQKYADKWNSESIRELEFEIYSYEERNKWSERMYRNYQNLSKEDRASGCESMGVNVARRLDEMSNRPAGLIENDDDLAEVKRAVALFDEGMPIYETIDAPNAEVSNYQDRLDIVRDEIVEIMEDFEWWKRNAIRR